MKVKPNNNQNGGEFMWFLYYIYYIHIYIYIDFNSSLSWLFGCPLLLN